MNVKYRCGLTRSSLIIYQCPATQLCRLATFNLICDTLLKIYRDLYTEGIVGDWLSAVVNDLEAVVAKFVNLIVFYYYIILLAVSR